MTDKLRLPNAGRGRFWSITHQPQKKRTPLRIELREKTIKSAEKVSLSMSRLIGFEDTVADRDKILDAAFEIKARAAKVDEFVGIHESPEV